MKRFSLFILLMPNLIFGSLCAQTKKIDSLKQELRTAKDDTNKVKTLNRLGRALEFNGDYDTAITYVTRAKQLAEKLNDKRGLSGAYGSLANNQYRKGNYPEALAGYFSALKISEELKDKRAMGSCYGNIGNIYFSTDDHRKAHEYYDKALKISEELGNKGDIAIHLAHVGLTYRNEADFISPPNPAKKDSLLNRSLDYSYRALILSEELKNSYSISIDLGNIGSALNELGNAPSISPSKRDSFFTKAIDCYLKALQLDKERNDKNGIGLHLGNIGWLYTDMKKYGAGEKYLKEAISLFRELGSLENEMNDQEKLSRLYEETGKYSLALIHFERHINIKDSLQNEENTKKAVRLEMNYEFGKKEAIAKADQEKKEAVTASESKKQQVIIWSVCGILVLVLTFAVFAYRSYLQKQKANIEITAQKHVIEEKQKEILDSIHYAKRIQTALLASDKYIQRNLKELKD